MKTEKKIKIVVADDHLSVIQGFIAILKLEPNFKIIGYALNGKELIKLIEKEEPDISLVDLEMPIMNGCEAIKIITSNFPKVKSIMLSSYYSEYFVSEILQVGACAYIAKDAGFDEIIFTINKVYNDGFSFSKKVSKILVSGQTVSVFENIVKQIALSDREIEVLKLVCKEKTNEEIASLLYISADTIRFHRKNIFRKTNSSSIVALVKYAIKNGITDID